MFNLVVSSFCFAEDCIDVCIEVFICNSNCRVASVDDGVNWLLELPWLIVWALSKADGERLNRPEVVFECLNIFNFASGGSFLILPEVNVRALKVVKVEGEGLFFDQPLLPHRRDIVSGGVDCCIALKLESIESSRQAKNAINRLAQTNLLLDREVFEIADTSAQLDACSIRVDVAFEESCSICPLYQVLADLFSLSGVVLVSFAVSTVHIFDH